MCVRLGVYVNVKVVCACACKRYACTCVHNMSVHVRAKSVCACARINLFVHVRAHSRDSTHAPGMKGGNLSHQTQRFYFITNQGFLALTLSLSCSHPLALILTLLLSPLDSRVSLSVRNYVNRLSQSAVSSVCLIPLVLFIKYIDLFL